MQEEHRSIVAVVDDDEAVRDSLRFLLEIAGYRVATFDSGCDFLRSDMIEEEVCLLLDQHMPKLTGLELLRRLRLRVRGRKLRIALMTGSPSPELTRQALELGVVDVLEKPLAEDVLLGFVQRPLS